MPPPSGCTTPSSCPSPASRILPRPVRCHHIHTLRCSTTTALRTLCSGFHLVCHPTPATCCAYHRPILSLKAGLRCADAARADGEQQTEVTVEEGELPREATTGCQIRAFLDSMGDGQGEGGQGADASPRQGGAASPAAEDPATTAAPAAGLPPACLLHPLGPDSVTNSYDTGTTGIRQQMALGFIATASTLTLVAYRSCRRNAMRPSTAISSLHGWGTSGAPLSHIQPR